MVRVTIVTRVAAARGALRASTIMPLDQAVLSECEATAVQCRQQHVCVRGCRRDSRRGGAGGGWTPSGGAHAALRDGSGTIFWYSQAPRHFPSDIQPKCGSSFSRVQRRPLNLPEEPRLTL